MQDETARREIDAERRFLVGLGGSCTTPLGIHAQVQGDRVVLRGFLSSVDGAKQIRDGLDGPAADAFKLADELLDRFWAKGAATLMGQT
jgi:porphobilinogen deaminase